MQIKLLDILVCPTCKGKLTLMSSQNDRTGDIESGVLKCQSCDKEFKIINGIPRFVPIENYASSFGMQWNTFKSEQIDSQNGFNLSETRFFAETGWSREWLKDKLILDVGCGAGRFLDVVSKTDAEVIGIDLSYAVEAARENTKGRKNVHIVQASIYELPFRSGTFDGAYCIGVAQHTPDPKKTIRAVAEMVKEGGRVGFFIYERKPWTKLYSKYLLRPFTKRLKNETLLKLIKGSMPILFPISEVTYRIPVFGKFFRFILPVSNYIGANVTGNEGLNIKQRYHWAIMDTFDMLAPEYDEPQTFEEVKKVLHEAGVTNITRTAGYGVCLDGKKKSSD